MGTQLEASLQRDIDRIRGKVQEMASRDGQALRDCLRALLERNRQLAYSIILRDQRVDELEKEIDRLCLEFLVRQQPVAGHLRFVYATIKINAELERIGDYAESIARQLLKISPLDPQPFTARFTEIANLSIPMLHDAVKAFLERDADLARRTMATEEQVDVLRNQINAELLRAEKDGQIPLEALNPFLTIARRFERVSDQAKNICEEVLYMCTGEYQKHKGTGVYRLLFVDEHNACRSQMAEAIGNSLNQPQFIFASAGLEPTQIDPAAINLLKEKGLDVSHHTSKAAEQIPNLDHYQIIVALAPEAKTAFPKGPTKAICLDWIVQDPSKVEGSAAEVKAAYESTYQFLHAHIQDLVEAVLGDKID